MPGCAAANVTVWRDGELVNQASSHPDPARLVAVQVASNRGPLIDAMTEGGPVSCPDTLTETRWPEFTTAALQMGVRCTETLSNRGAAVVVLTLLGLRPRAIDTAAASTRSIRDADAPRARSAPPRRRPRQTEADQLPLAEILVAYGGALVGAVSDYDDSRRVATQLRDAAEARAIVDQAKGILMHALGCTADDALERMREVSQRSNLRATEVARRVIDAHSRPGGRDARRELGQLAELANRKKSRAYG